MVVGRTAETRSGPRPSVQRDAACPRSSPTSTPRCAAGLNTSSTATARHSRRSTAGSVAGCAISCANSMAGRGSRAPSTISGGPMLSLLSMGFSTCETPMPKPASPLAGKTIDWRAGCGRSARPVRREGGSNPIGSPYPYLQADAYGGFNGLYDAKRSPRPITEAACWSHGRRKFFVLADLAKSAPGKKHGAPLAVEAVRQVDAIFAVEREINGLPAEQRLAMRTTRIAPLISELESWMRSERARLSRHADVAKAMDYMLKRWAAFTRFLSDGRICLTNNAAERALRGIAIGRKNWLFAGSDRGGERAAAMFTLIATAKLNNIDPQAWLADVLRRIADHPARRLNELLPWGWHAPVIQHTAAA